ncbi:uncharacterized protein LOC127255996 isoform X3 [Andrographis paniculata]|uniref:uncharacterized protein LOC127255996 isoform X2 n=1 Tax=Andrographis paniculata TaxID=175694 RepID=UPI0021E98B91|nr:uncharacterized protein LOC127255996 isoform X2 [Andrographis paniculata]XP_051137782.1 uncharacterized protein LOC127255996 isoform X3 [Andrographis paniculata]
MYLIIPVFTRLNLFFNQFTIFLFQFWLTFAVGQVNFPVPLDSAVDRSIQSAMAAVASSSSCTVALLLSTAKLAAKPTLQNQDQLQCSLPRPRRHRNDLHGFASRSGTIIQKTSRLNAMPETAGDLLSSLTSHLPGLPGFHLPGGDSSGQLTNQNSTPEVAEDLVSSVTSLLPGIPGFHLPGADSSGELVNQNPTPEIAGDLLSSLTSHLPGIPGFHLPGGEGSWLAGIVGLCVTVPLLIQRVLSFTKEVDLAAQTVEKIADAVEHVAEEVDKVAEGIGAALPDGGLKSMVHFVEVLAEETAKDAQNVEDLMDKVEELDEKVDEFLGKKTKDTEKA